MGSAAAGAAGIRGARGSALPAPAAGGRRPDPPRASAAAGEPLPLAAGRGSGAPRAPAGGAPDPRCRRPRDAGSCAAPGRAFGRGIAPAAARPRRFSMSNLKYDRARPARVPFDKGELIVAEYTARIKESGEVFLTTDAAEAKKANLGASPAKFRPQLVSIGQPNFSVPKALDEILAGAEVGAELEVEVPPAKGFGEVERSKVKTLPLRKLGDDADRAEPGYRVNVDDRAGVVRFVSSGRVTVDFNHKYAGQTILYSARVTKHLESDEDKTGAILRQRFGVDKVKFSRQDNTVAVHVPEALVRSVDLGRNKQLIQADVFKYVPSARVVVFIDSFFNPGEPRAEEDYELTGPVEREGGGFGVVDDDDEDYEDDDEDYEDDDEDYEDDDEEDDDEEDDDDDEEDDDDDEEDDDDYEDEDEDDEDEDDEDEDDEDEDDEDEDDEDEDDEDEDDEDEDDEDEDDEDDEEDDEDDEEDDDDDDDDEDYDDEEDDEDDFDGNDDDDDDDGDDDDDDDDGGKRFSLPRAPGK